MKTWYYAVCEKCGEGCNMFVSNPTCTAHYLSKYDVEIQAFLSKHFACNLRLVNCETAELDGLWEQGFKRQDEPFMAIARAKKSAIDYDPFYGTKCRIDDDYFDTVLSHYGDLGSKAEIIAQDTNIPLDEVIKGLKKRNLYKD